MKDNSSIRLLLRALWLGVTETIIWLPILLCLRVWLLPNPAWLIWVPCLPILYTITERLTARYSRLRQLYRLFIAVVLGTAPAIALFTSWIDVTIAAAAGFVFAMRGMEAIVPEDERQVREVLLPALLVYFIVSIAASFIVRFDDYRLLLTAGGVFTLLLTIRRANRLTLISANQSGTGKGIPSSVVRRNRTLILLFTAVAAIVVLFKQLEALWASFVSWINGILSGLGTGSATIPDETQPDMPINSGMMPPAEGKTGWFWIILDYIAILIGIAIVAVLLYLLFRSLLRIPLLAAAVAKWFAAWRERRPTAATGGYEDEVESLSAPAPLSEMMNRIRSLLSRGESWSSMSPEQQIRYLFRRRFKDAAKHGYTYDTSLTPSENLAALHQGGGRQTEGDGPLVDVYADVRYGSKSAAKEDAAQLKSKLDL